MVVPHLFISYRTSDTREAADRLAQYLDQALEPGQFFRDVERIKPGEPFPERIDQELAKANVMLVLIGRTWFTAENPEQAMKCIDVHDDWVRREVETALANQGRITVIPVRIDGAERLKPEKFKSRPKLAGLANLNDLELHKEQWAEHAEKLLATLAGHGLRKRAGDTPRALAPRELLAAYRDKLIRSHTHLMPFFGDLGDQLLEKVYVELELSPECNDEEDAAEHEPMAKAHDALRRGPQQLRELLLDPAAKTPPRLAIEGEPGAGKTTLARDLARRLASEGKTPIFLPLARYGTPTFDPFLAAARTATGDEPTAADLAQALRDRAAAGDVVALFDGLDEVDPQLIDAVADRIVALSRSELANVPIAVLARPIALERRDLARFARAKVQKLSRASREQLAERLLQADAPPFLDKMREQPALAELCSNPLMLTLAAMVARDSLRARKPLPLRRGRLYAEAIRLLLERGYGLERRGVKDPDLARSILRRLSLQLHEQGGEAWDREVISEAVWRLREADASLNFKVKETWENDKGFREDLGTNAGVLGPHDGVDEPWRYLHRSLREYLAAEELTRLDEAALTKRIVAWQEEVVARRKEEEAQRQDRVLGKFVFKKPDPARWGEVYALVCSIVKEPIAVLKAIRKVSPALVLRTLPAVEGMSARAGLEFLFATEGWEASDLLAVLTAWSVPPETIAVELLRATTSDRSVEQLAYLWFTAETFGATIDRAEFFRRAGRPIERAPTIEWVDVPSGQFLMGSPDSEPQRLANEGPQHHVTVPAFRLATTSVTNRQYLAFDPHHQVHKWPDNDEELPGHPVVNVSWWHAYVFCAWLGARLPSEAEWEYACRAGTTTPFSFGANVTPDQVNYNGNHPYARGKKGKFREQTVAVGSLPANAWGLHEMHGNVWEWCEDTMHDNYDGAPTDGSAWLASGSRERVLRGGSWIYYAWGCRSAYRLARHPGARDVIAGFRPASSSLTPLTPSPPA